MAISVSRWVHNRCQKIGGFVTPASNVMDGDNASMKEWLTNREYQSMRTW
jgi:hypothetical protein